jgi:hypothetical protein
VAKSFEHLSDAQLEHYGTKSFAVTPEKEQKIEAHLEDCANCRSRVLENQRVRFGLLASSSIKSGSGAAPGFIERGSVHPVAVEPGSVQGLSSEDGTPGYPVPADWDPYKPASTACIVPNGPTEDDLRNLAAGTIAPDKAMAITQHAVECPHCASILRLFIEDFSDDLTAPELEEELAAEKDFLSQLKSSTPEWQKEIAAQAMQANRVVNPSPASVANPSSTSGANASSTSGANTSSTSGAKIFGWPMRRVLAPTAIAASALLAFGLWFTQRDTPEKVEKLLAQAYTEQRTMEMRIPYAAHADFRQTRSGETSSLLNSPAALRKAADLIATHLKDNPEDPDWLLASARFDLLDWNYKLSLSTLDKITDLHAIDSDSITLTRALAIYEQGESEPARKDQSYGQMINLLGSFLKDRPNDSTALFNRALACEKIAAYECAASDFESLLRIDKDSGWSAEARDHLNKIREKKTLGH